MAGARALVQEAGVVPRSDEDDDVFFCTDDENVQVERSVAPVSLSYRVCVVGRTRA